MADFRVYGRPGCSYCSGAVQLLQRQGLAFEYIDMWKTGLSKEELAAEIGRPVYTVPQILHGDRYVGGYSDLIPYLKTLSAG